MKTAFLVAAVLSGCVTTDDPDPPAADAGVSAAAKCGPPPNIPRWSYLPDPNDASRVFVDAKVWDAHVAWVVSMTAWSDCVTPLI